MKTKNLFLITSLCGVALMTSGCNMCPMQKHGYHEQYAKQKPHHQKPAPQQVSETVVFYQTYEAADIDDVNAKMFTRSSRGGESAMGTIKFKETDKGLKMKIDLTDLRPGKTYTAHIYQCAECNDSICCDTSPMNVDLPKIKAQTGRQLQQSYIVRGLTAAQLDNAKIVLTRDGGYKAAWGTLNQ